MKILDFDNHSLEIKHQWLTTDQDFNLKELYSFRAYLDFKNSEVTLVGLDTNQPVAYFCKMYTEFYRKDLILQPVERFMDWLVDIHKYLVRHNVSCYNFLCKIDAVSVLFPHLNPYHNYDLDRYTFELLKRKDLFDDKRIRCTDYKPLIIPDAMGFKKVSRRICE